MLGVARPGMPIGTQPHAECVAGAREPEPLGKDYGEFRGSRVGLRRRIYGGRRSVWNGAVLALETAGVVVADGVGMKGEEKNMTGAGSQRFTRHEARLGIELRGIKFEQAGMEIEVAPMWNGRKVPLVGLLPDVGARGGDDAAVSETQEGAGQRRLAQVGCHKIE